MRQIYILLSVAGWIWAVVLAIAILLSPKRPAESARSTPDPTDAH